MALDPVRLFRRWFREARHAKAPLPEACALATATPAGRPSVRFVLLKQADRLGFVFFTDARSRKGRELAANPYGSLAFYWHRTGRQVRVEGRVSQIPSEEADAYWATRPRGSQLSAAASEQSAPVAGRKILLDRIRRLREKYRGREIPRPAHWKGFRLAPSAIEFWVRGSHRLHSRQRFVRRGRGWKALHLQP